MSQDIEIYRLLSWYEGKRLKIEEEIGSRMLPRRRIIQDKVEALTSDLRGDVTRAESAERTTLVAELDAELLEKLPNFGVTPRHKALLEHARRASYKEARASSSKPSDRAVIMRGTNLTAAQDGFLGRLMEARQTTMAGALRLIVQEYMVAHENYDLSHPKPAKPRHEANAPLEKPRAPLAPGVKPYAPAEPKSKPEQTADEDGAPKLPVLPPRPPPPPAPRAKPKAAKS